MNNIFFICFLLICTTVSLGQTIAFVDVEKVLNQMGDYANTLKEIETQVNTYHEVLDSVQAEIDLKYKKLEVERFLLTSTAIQSREDDIRKLEKKKNDLNYTYFSSDGFLVESRKKLVQPYLDKILKVVQDYAVEKGIDIILDKKKQNNIIFASPALDVTKDILNIIQSK